MAKRNTLKKTADKLNKQVRKARTKLDALIAEQHKATMALRAHDEAKATKQAKKDMRKAAKNDPSPAIPASAGEGTDMASVAAAVSSKATKKTKGTDKKSKKKS